MKTKIAAIMLSLTTFHSSVWAATNCGVDSNIAQDASRHEGRRITVQIEGEGPDVILIPGLSSPRDVWDATVAAQRGCHRLHIVQIRGFGDDAGANGQGPVLGPVVEELASYISEGKLQHPAIIGHSLGGLAALMIGARYPELPGKIMVVDAVPFIGTIFNPSATVETIKAQAEAMASGIRAQYGKPVPAAPTDDPGPNSQSGFWSNAPDGRLKVARWNLASDPRVTAQAFYDDMTTDMRAELPKIIAPVTLLYAQDDSAMTAEMAKSAFEPQYAGTARFEAQMITGSRHFIMLDQPEKFDRALQAFLSQ